MKRARLSFSYWSVRYPPDGIPNYVLRYRFNGKAWHNRLFDADEVNLLNTAILPAAIAPVVDIPLADLVQGTNTLEFVAVNIPQGYPPGVGNIDLILTP